MRRSRVQVPSPAPKQKYQAIEPGYFLGKITLELNFCEAVQARLQEVTAQLRFLPGFSVCLDFFQVLGLDDRQEAGRKQRLEE